MMISQLPAHTRVGQVLTFLFTREVLSGRLGTRKLNKEQIDLIYQVLEENIGVCINGLEKK